ncbi:hypothetical protein B0I35DRAFT_51432 [Stachybotrys elegans]|uniref:Uncharacterized protein n=1 Tax=Stachybotrys elegans TaxID=80388 RepID=A0A8K0SMX0_9HYPO|nr:hypothetical protein B0I35DRAFT_51432 [Stachybotrys elegans]
MKVVLPLRTRASQRDILSKTNRCTPSSLDAIPTMASASASKRPRTDQGNSRAKFRRLTSTSALPHERSPGDSDDSARTLDLTKAGSPDWGEFDDALLDEAPEFPFENIPSDTSQFDDVDLSELAPGDPEISDADWGPFLEDPHASVAENILEQTVRKAGKLPKTAAPKKNIVVPPTPTPTAQNWMSLSWDTPGLLVPNHTHFAIQEILGVPQPLDVTCELFVRVARSTRENFARRQLFKFRNLLPGSDVSLNGVLMG